MYEAYKLLVVWHNTHNFSGIKSKILIKKKKGKLK